jgi:hypothetical protein
VIVLPPFDDGAVHETLAAVFPAVAVTPVGVAGTVAGVTGVDAADSGLVPMLLVAVTVKVYAVPLVRPVTTLDVPVAGTAVCATPAINGVTEYAVMGLPPSDGAVQVTVADASPLVAATPVGAAGAVTGAVGVMEDEGAEAEPVPTAFLAVTVKVYAVPLVRPPTVVDVAAGDPETVTGVCAVAPTYGVTVYPVI